MGLAASAGFWLPAPARARWKPADPEHLRRWNGINPTLIKVAENYSSPSLLGPRMSDDLVELIAHMYRAEEAEVLQYLTPWSSKTAAELAKQADRPIEEVQAILDRIVSFQNSLLTFGREGKAKKYNILPIVPGTFELVLVKPEESLLTDWHKEFSRRFSKLYNEGAFAIYWDDPSAWGMVRYIPVYPTIRDNPAALPSDKLPAILERYQDLAVGLCQCTTTAKYVDRYCGRPHFTCMTMGEEARSAIQSGVMRRVELKEALEIKTQAEQAGLSTWMMNLDHEHFKSNISCSCCGCCCFALRSLTQFNKPGFVARPHFMPKIDQERCRHCGTCVDRCNMDAHQVTEDTHTFDTLRCIGCGLCASTCPAEALTMEPVKSYKPPYQSLARIVAEKGPKFISMINREKRRRKQA
ncbi:MAG: hypothetical protein A2V67_08310 [Deltaproteobacteria bacterium RBG_13_61_14]|nr:MAG: hypothetical protein A2V67_08310 [Deltaproteobacteria bacterium RBG_13_61_14]